MSLVKGDGVLLSFWDGSAYKPFACFRSITFNMLSDFIGKSTVGSGDWKEKEVVALDWNFSTEGIPYYFTNDIDFNYIVDLWLAKAPVRVQTSVTDENGITVLTLTGDAIITNVSLNGAVNNIASVNITGEGTGELSNVAPFRIILIEVDEPDPGDTTLTFDFDEYEDATAYTIRRTDLTTGTVTYDTAGGPPRIFIGDSTHNYSFAYRPEFIDGPGEWSLEIYYEPNPVGANMTNSDGSIMINSDGSEMINN